MYHILPFPNIYNAIPCTIDDDLSYYQTLTKLITILNDLGKELETIENAVNAGSMENAEKFDEIQKEIDDLKKTIPEVRQQVTELLEVDGKLERFTTQLQQTIDSINSRFDNLKNEVTQSVENRFSQLSSQLKTEVDDKFTEKEKEINALVDGFKADMEAANKQFKNEVQSQLDIILGRTTEIERMLANFNTDLDERFAIQRQELIDMVEKYFREGLIYYAINPVTGEIENVNDVLDTLYYVTSHALSCEQYAELGLTAEEFETMDMTCLQYLYMLYEHWWAFHELWMRCPLDGNMQSVRTVLEEFFRSRFAKPDALTADEYDALALTADGYDTQMVSAQNYDWNGSTVLS